MNGAAAAPGAYRAGKPLGTQFFAWWHSATHGFGYDLL